jgi:hypothetical protein
MEGKSQVPFATELNSIKFNGLPRLGKLLTLRTNRIGLWLALVVAATMDWPGANEQ